MDRVSVSSLNGALPVDSPQTMTVMRRGNRSLRRRSLCSTARALAALAISLRQKSDATPLAQWSVNRKDPWAFVENVLPCGKLAARRMRTQGYWRAQRGTRTPGLLLCFYRIHRV